MNKPLPKYPRPSMSDVLKRHDASRVLDPKGNIFQTGPHIANNPVWRSKLPNGKWQSHLATTPAYHTNAIKTNGSGQTVAPSAVPLPITPGEPTDIGPVTDLGANILFTDPPTVQDVQQWAIADCYYLSPIGSMLYHSPWYITQLVSKNAKGGFDVQFRRNGALTIVTVDDKLGAPPITCGVNPTTGAVGVCVLEKAYAYFRTGANTYASLNWGASNAAFNDLGCQSVYLNATQYSVVTSVLASLAASLPIVAQTNGTIPNGLPLIESHVYMVLNVIPTGNTDATFILANPWGIDGAGSDGNDDGIITLNFAAFSKGFSLVNCVTKFSADIPTTPPNSPPLVIIEPPVTLPKEVYASKTLPGDVNNDGRVDIQDQTIISNNWQQHVTSGTLGDANYDGVVDIQDLTAMANNWQKGVPVASGV